MMPGSSGEPSDAYPKPIVLERPSNMTTKEHWFWIVTSETYPYLPRKTTWRMTASEAKARYGDAATKVEGSLEVGHVPKVPSGSAAVRVSSKQRTSA